MSPVDAAVPNVALVADRQTPLTMRFAAAPDAVATQSRAVVKVAYVSINHGDLNDAASGRIPTGGVLGTDAAGVVAAAATDGAGPQVGERVVAFAQGAFAQRIAVDVADLAVVPETVELADAATLPVAGLAALRTLRESGSLLGKRVLITGAAGGVGHLAVQLAAASGARVLAAVRDLSHAADLREAGADEVVTNIADLQQPVDAVLDSVGGAQLVAAWQHLAPGGVLHSIGWTSGDPAVLFPYATVGPPKTLRSHLNLTPTGEDLSTLVAQLARGVLQPRIEWAGSWTDFAKPLEALRDRRLKGKAVLAVDAIGEAVETLR